MDKNFEEFHSEFPELKEGAIGSMVKSAFAPTSQALKGMQTGMQQFMKNTKNSLVPGGAGNSGEPLQSAPAQQPATPAQQPQKQQKPKNVLNSFASGERQQQADANAAQKNASDPNKAINIISGVLDVVRAIGQIGAAPQQPQHEAELLRLYKDLWSIQEGIDPMQAVNAAKNFSSQIGNKDASQLSVEEMNDLLELATALADKNVVKALLPKVYDNSIKQKIQSLDVSTLQTAIQAYQNAPSEQKGEIIKADMDPAMLNGVLANALAQVQDKGALKKYLAPIVMRYGQTDNLTAYSWKDIQSMVNIAKKFGANIDIDMSGVDPNSSPSGAQQPQTQAQPQQQAPSQVEPAAGDTVGQIVSKLQNDPDMIRDLVDYSISKKPKNLKSLATKYGIAITQEDLDFINQQSFVKGKK